MKYLDNFLSSGHEFDGSDNLQIFRFSLLNSLMVIASFFTFIHYFASICDLMPYPPIYEKTLLFYAFACLFSVCVLRIKKENYVLAVNIVLLTSLILFYTALMIENIDEFRLIWFFLVVFASFVLMGKRYGTILMILILVSVITLIQIYDLGFSEAAQFTFVTSFLIFASFSYFFLKKIEQDAVEFEILNEQLQESVTEERQQREQQEQMLLRQYRMANMGEMLDAIAHQWRQPLMHINSVLMNMDNALEAEKQDKNYLTEKVDEVASLTSHMSQTIEDFRGLFKTEQAQVGFTIESAIHDVIVLMKNNLSDIDVDYNRAEETSLLGYKSELMQVFIIILSNMVEALNNQATVNKKIHIEILPTEHNMQIVIEDNAGGIDAEHLATIFDPYFTTKQQSGGTGLGLYIAKIIIEHKMAGKIRAENTATGAKFTIEVEK